jgi:signal peptidase I
VTPADEPKSTTNSIVNRLGGWRPGRRGRSHKQRSTTNSIIELVVIVLIALGLALGIQAFFVKPYRIPSGSMEPTLSIGQRVLVDRIGMHFGEPHVGEIAVFHPPEGAEQEMCGSPSFRFKAGEGACDEPDARESSVNFIKRIVAGPGDTIYISEGHVYRRPAGKSTFTRESDAYIRPCPDVPECVDFTKPITIPAGHWFMMGDNRGESDDSRFWGPVPKSWIIGDAFATYWPPDRIGFL